MLTLDQIYQAAYILKDTARKTDMIYAPEFAEGREIYLKTENLQLTGSFKLRGAYYKISQLTPEQRAAGIIACSAGNHAQGVALASTRMGIKSTICMPDGAPISKVEATRHLGAEVVLVKGTYDDAHDKAVELQKESGATFIHPFDDDHVIAGQGTIGLEILDQLKDTDAVLCPIGGGGLISGVAYAIKSLNPNIKIYGVQAANAPSMYESLKKKEIVTVRSVATFADGIAVKTPGETTFDLVSRYVDDVVTVTEDQIAAAILRLLERQKLITEGAGAVSVAAAMFSDLPLEGKKTVCILSGGNIDVNILSRVITRGLITSGRNTMLQIALEDKPGQLEGVSRIIAECGGNVIAVHHERSDPNTPISSCILRVGMETASFEQIRKIREKLTEEGFHILSD
ncbi:MAG: threonine ammonia-lyase [Parasporobacterium sp.]|nr:threonine ammonia-lyase [Parasporobacterium sp.]